MDKKTVLLIVADSDIDLFEQRQKDFQSWGIKCPMVHFANGKTLLGYLSNF